jgi:NAD(P)-dependent dehydrogenase (short-subunit alcohol dehydrogenase family)
VSVSVPSKRRHPATNTGLPVASLDGKVAVITGASAGVGHATAVALHDSGARVMLGARNAIRLKELVADLGEDRADWVETDVRDPDDARRLLDAAATRFGRVDLVVANAGIGAYGGILDHGDDDVRAVVDTNLTGVIWTVRAAVPHLRRSGGDIVVVSSVAGLRGRADEAVYAATKHGLVGLTGSLDRELRPDGIRVMTLCPGAVATDFAQSYERRRRADRDRMLHPAEVASAVCTMVAQPPSMRTLMWSMRAMAADN